MTISRYVMLKSMLFLCVSLSVCPASGAFVKIDFSELQGGAVGWDSFADFVQDEVYEITDWSGGGDDDVTLTVLDNPFTPNNPDVQNVDFVYDGVPVPASVVDDYLYRTDDTAGTTARFRFDNLDAGEYNITVFEGRPTDTNGQFAKIWVGDSSGSGEPASENTGDWAHSFSTLSIKVSEGDTLWYRHLEDNTGGISGMIINPNDPFTINGSGETLFENFDEMDTVMPRGWSGEGTQSSGRVIDSRGLLDGPLEGAVESATGLLNLGGNPERFTSTVGNVAGSWKDDLNNNGAVDEADVIADGAIDRALGNGRANQGDPASLAFEVEVVDSPLRALTLDWDLEIWGGDPESVFRGTDGAGYDVELSVGGTGYYTDSVSLVPGDLFDTNFDGGSSGHDATLIDGNLHSVRGNSSGIVEVLSADGAVGNLIQVTFDADRAGATEGWIQAVDNVRVRALAAGDAQADGDVDPADLIQLLAGGAFGQGNIDATWGQGDFDNDGDFDGTDILAVVQGLRGEFPKTYAHDPSNGVPDVLINPATGNITLDTNGTTIGSIVMDSAAGIFNGPNSPSWDAPGDFAADIDTQISMPISFTNPGYTGVDDLGDGIMGDLVPGFDILADLTIKYLDSNGDLLDAEAHVVPEPSSLILLGIGGLAFILVRRSHRA